MRICIFQQYILSFSIIIFDVFTNTSFFTTSCSFQIVWFDCFLRLLIYCDPMLELRWRTSVAWKFTPKNCMIPNRSYIHNLLYPKVNKIGCQRWPYVRVEIKMQLQKCFDPIVLELRRRTSVAWKFTPKNSKLRSFPTCVIPNSSHIPKGWENWLP